MFQKALREYEAVSHAQDIASCSGIDLRRLAWVRPLASDYASNFANVASLYAGDPASRDAWTSAIARAQQHRRSRNEVAAVVHAQQEHRGAPPEARAAASLLENPETVAIVTGQQAGAFGGPLFTLLKALTAVQLARRTAIEHRVPAVAIFWVDAEDHDWNEVQSATVLDGHLHPKTVSIPDLDGAGHLPVAALTLDGRIASVIDELAGALAPTDFTDWVIDSLADWVDCENVPEHRDRVREQKRRDHEHYLRVYRERYGP